MKTIVYIDGYNLFYGCLKHSNDKWLDLVQLFERILRAQDPAIEIDSIKFFTADILAKVANRGQEAHDAQGRYHRALQRLYPEKIEIIKGYYSLEPASLLVHKRPPNKDDRVDVWKLEEKQTDVNIALQAYRDVAKGLAEQIVVVSSDSDIVPALEAIREDFDGQIKIGVVLPIRKNPQQKSRPKNKKLRDCADWTRSHITEEELAFSHLPEKIPTNKKPILKPEYW